MACEKSLSQHQNYVPVCASVLCEAPGVIYVSIDPEVWKIRCRQCQEKTEHKCALKKLKNKFRGDPSKRRVPKDGAELVGKKLDEAEEEGKVKKEEKAGKEPEVKGDGAGGGKGRKGGSQDSMDLEPPEQIPDNFCACADRPKNVPPKPYVCLCDIYKPTNFMLKMEVTGEFKPAYVPKKKK